MRSLQILEQLVILVLQPSVPTMWAKIMRTWCLSGMGYSSGTVPYTGTYEITAVGAAGDTIDMAQLREVVGLT